VTYFLAPPLAPGHMNHFQCPSPVEASRADWHFLPFVVFAGTSHAAACWVRS